MNDWAAGIGPGAATGEMGVATVVVPKEVDAERGLGESEGGMCGWKVDVPTNGTGGWPVVVYALR